MECAQSEKGVQSTVGEFRGRKSVLGCSTVSHAHAAFLGAELLEVPITPTAGFIIYVLDQQNIHHHGAVMVPLVLLVAALLQLRASVGVAYTPSHGWDMYYDWALPSGTKAAALWTVDANFTVTTDPGKTTFYYWSHYTLWVPSVVGSVSQMGPSTHMHPDHACTPCLLPINLAPFL